MKEFFDAFGGLLKEGDRVEYYCSFGMWIPSEVIATPEGLAIRTPENPIYLDEFIQSYEEENPHIAEIKPIPAQESAPAAASPASPPDHS